GPAHGHVGPWHLSSPCDHDGQEGRLGGLRLGVRRAEVAHVQPGHTLWICFTAGVHAIALGSGRLVRGPRGMVAFLGLNYTDRSVRSGLKKERPYPPFALSPSRRAASRATSAVSGAPWITAVTMAPSTSRAMAGASVAAPVPTDSSTTPRSSANRRLWSR